MSNRTEIPRLRYACLTLAALLGCGEDVHAPAGPQVPVVQGLLVLGETRQSLSIQWSTPSDSVVGGPPSPVPASEVQLTLTPPNGSSLPFLPAPGVPGRFDAETAVEAGVLYEVSGTIAGTAISASTRVPAALSILEPASDTIRLPSSCDFGCTLPFRWSAAGAVEYLIVEQGRDQTLGTTRDTVGDLRLFRAADTLLLRIVAYDPNAAGFLFSQPPRSTARGAFGYVGAASAAERVVIWE